MKVTVYGSMLCPDCRNALDAYKKHGIEVDFHNITDALPELKKFLALRDDPTNEALFAPVRASGGIGIPCVVAEDGKPTLDWEEIL